MFRPADCPSRARGLSWCARWLLTIVMACVATGGPSWLSTLPAWAEEQSSAGQSEQPPARADEQPPPPQLPDEYTIKAVFLYSFGRYIEWPESAFADASSPFVIGVLGEDQFGGALDEIAKKKTIQGRRIVIRRFATLEEYRQPCQILFVSRSLTAEQQAAVIVKTQEKPVFVVGETPGFAEHGATSNFVVEGDRIRFEINIEAVRRAQLRMDAKLLSLGKPVDAPRSAASTPGSVHL